MSWSASSAAMSAGSTRTTWSNSRPLASEAGTTSTRASMSSSPAEHGVGDAGRGQPRRGRGAPKASGTISPIEPAGSRSLRTTSTRRRDQVASRVGCRARRGDRRTDLGCDRLGAIVGSSRAAIVDHVPRHPEAQRQLLQVCLRLPEMVRARRPTPTAHGVVACARSPRIVADPVEHCRPTDRSIIGDRSCASSSDDVAEARRPLEQVRRLVDQHGVVQRPAGAARTLRRLRPRAAAPAPRAPGSRRPPRPGTPGR